MFPSSAWQLEKGMNGTSFHFFFWITSPSGRECLGPDLTVQKCICVCIYYILLSFGNRLFSSYWGGNSSKTLGDLTCPSSPKVTLWYEILYWFLYLLQISQLRIIIVNIYEVVISHTLVSQADPKMALNDPHFLMFTPLYNLFPLSVGWPNDFFF